MDTRAHGTHGTSRSSATSTSGSAKWHPPSTWAAPRAWSTSCASAATGTCFDQVELTPSEYEHVRASPIRFLLQHGHLDPLVDRLVAENERFLTVEKIGDRRADRGRARPADVSVRLRRENPGL